MKYDDNAIASPREALSADRVLPPRLPPRAFVPFLAGGCISALSYGASFMLPDALGIAGLPPTVAGGMIGAGTIATLLGSLIVGRVAQRAGMMPPIIGAAVIMGVALACFAGVGVLGAWVGYLGGLLLGLGWAVVYLLMPVQIIQNVRANGRLEALMLLSGSQMVGIGLSVPIGRVLTPRLGGVSHALLFDAALCGIAALLLVVASRGFRSTRPPPVQTVTLSLHTTRAVLRSRTAIPVAMIGLAACSFSGLSTFQSLLATAHGVPPEAFFLTFTATTVTLRFSVASRIGRLPLARLALALAAAMLIGLLGLASSGGSLTAYIAATLVFSIGYGLNYSTLNALVVDLAERNSILVSIASQVFTIGYFVGLFGFPAIAARTIGQVGIGAMLTVLMAIAAINLGMALLLVLPSLAVQPRRPS